MSPFDVIVGVMFCYAITDFAIKAFVWYEKTYRLTSVDWLEFKISVLIMVASQVYILARTGWI